MFESKGSERLQIPKESQACVGYATVDFLLWGIFLAVPYLNTHFKDVFNSFIVFAFASKT